MVNRRIIIVGGGVIGLSIAEHCLRKGFQPVVLDKGSFAQEASWAGAGYLDLRSASRVGGAFFDICRKSYDLFPEWIDRLHKESGIDPELIHSGSLDVAFNLEEEDSIRQMESNLRTFGFSGEWWTALETAKREPQISPGLKSSFFFKSTSQIRPPRLTRALIRVLQKGGIELREVEPIEDILVKGNRAIGVRTSKGVIEGEGVIVASGAWSGLLMERMGIPLAVKPYRGQVVMFRGQPGLFHHILFTGIQKAFTYLVPRLDGHIYVGSTLEDQGFDKNTTLEGMEKLKNGAIKLLPSLSRQLIENTWAGLRPGSVDGWPFLGKVPGHEGFWVATGHFTHGLLLSAVTGYLMAQILSGDKPSLDLNPFSIDRKPHLTAGI